MKVASLKFLNKVCGSLINECEYDAQNDSEITVRGLLQTLNRQGLVNKLHKMLLKRDCPLMFFS